MSLKCIVKPKTHLTEVLFVTVISLFTSLFLFHSISLLPPVCVHEGVCVCIHVYAYVRNVSGDGEYLKNYFRAIQRGSKSDQQHCQ